MGEYAPNISLTNKLTLIKGSTNLYRQHAS